MPSPKGTIRLFQIFGINVFLHWSWFVVAVYEIQRQDRYSSVVWSVFEYLALFAIVMLHECGHVLACRSVGGIAEQIVLWPLGGVAYVNAPARPGATLWSIAAGPLVNLALAPVLGVLLFFYYSPGSDLPASNLTVFVRELNVLNLVLFFFNMLPLYPLDGGKILRALLWFVVGRARSLMATVIIGFIGVAGLGVLALQIQSMWLGLIAVFAAMQCITGYKQSQALKRLEELPRRPEGVCPACKMNPPIGAFWKCSACQTAFDTFATGATCPKCARLFPTTTCLDCGAQNPLAAWFAPGKTATERPLTEVVRERT
jgi:Zn-dependent protease